MVINPSITEHVLPIHVLTSFSVDEILLMSYMNWSTNFRGLPFNEGMASQLVKEIWD